MTTVASPVRDLGPGHPALPPAPKPRPQWGVGEGAGLPGRTAAEPPAGAPGGRQTKFRPQAGRAQPENFVFMAPKDKCVGGFGVPTIHLASLAVGGAAQQGPRRARGTT